MSSLYFLGQNNQIDIQHHFFGYVMSLALASHDTKAQSMAHGTVSSFGTRTISSCPHITLYGSVCASYEPTAINNVNRNSGIYTFYITGIYATYTPHAQIT